MVPPAWPMYMPSYLPGSPAQQTSMQAEREELARQCHDLEARELEVERMTRALILNAVRDAEAKSATPLVESSRSRTQEQAFLKMPKCAISQVQRSLALHRPPQGSSSPVLLLLRL